VWTVKIRNELRTEFKCGGVSVTRFIPLLPDGQHAVIFLYICIHYLNINKNDNSI
jgi:hypothetical protein